MLRAGVYAWVFGDASFWGEALLNERVAMRITLNVPEQYLIEVEPAELARRILLYAAVLMYQSGELSVGAAVEFAGVDRFTFLAECQRHGISTVKYPAEELVEELAALR